MTTMIRKGAGALIALAACAATASAFAAGTMKDPKTLVLRTADFPAGATSGPDYAVSPSFYGTKEYSLTFSFLIGDPNFKNPGSRKEEVTSDVVVSANAAGAETGYKRMLASFTGFGAGTTVLHLPAYGDEQYTDFYAPPKGVGGMPKGWGRGQLIVRKNGVVWRLLIDNIVGSGSPSLTQAQAVSELKKYALAMKRHVGSG